MDYFNPADWICRSASSRELFYTLPPDLLNGAPPYGDLTRNSDGLHRAAQAARLRRRRSEITGDCDPVL